MRWWHPHPRRASPLLLDLASALAMSPSSKELGSQRGTASIRAARHCRASSIWMSIMCLHCRSMSTTTSSSMATATLPLASPSLSYLVMHLIGSATAIVERLVIAAVNSVAAHVLQCHG
uniref:Secreted protein n=1 Tax=Arundo donax TaxID=35708 RepID=A0A0A9DT76_ARUDO